MYRAKVAGMDEFRESKDAWNSLASKMFFPSIFCTWEWIYTWWEQFGDKYEPLILFIYDGADLKGILPLASRNVVVRNDWLTGRILSYCGSGEVYPDHLDIISSSEEAAPCLNAVTRYLLSDYKEWDVLQLSGMSEGNNFMTWLACENAFSTDIKQTSVAPFISLPGGSEGFLNQFHAKKRYHLKKVEKTLFEERGVKYTSCAEREDSDTLKNLFELHAGRANQKRIVSTFQGGSIVDFHARLIGRLRQNDWLWLRSLRTDEKVIAVFYGFSYEGRVFYYQIGHDTGWARYGPGKVLMYNAIKEACEKKYGEFDFLRGNEEYKSYWTKDLRLLFTANIYNRSFRGALSNSLQRTKTTLKKIKSSFTSFA